MERHSNGRRKGARAGRSVFAVWQSRAARATHGRIAALTLVAALALWPMAATPANGALVSPLGQADITPVPVTTIPAPRYQVISDMIAMERQIADLQNDVRVLQLLRAHDIQMYQRERAEDQKRITSLEVTVGKILPAQCRR